jgi:hypothetical protein
MKILAYLSLLTLCSALHAQSYWYGGMTRVPGGESDSFVTAFNIGGQSFGHNLTKITNLRTGETFEPGEEDDTDIGFQTFQIGGEAAWVQDYFDLEGGLDLSLSGMNSDIADLDELYLGFNFRFGGVIKYDFNPSEDLTITPYLRSGLSFEFVTNDLAVPTTTYTVYGPITTYDYYDYGSSLFNTFFNMRLGTSLRWKGLVTGIALGKYFPIAGDLSDVFDNIPDQDPIDPLFLQLNLGYEFSDYSTLSLGWRLEWYDFSRTVNEPVSGDNYKADFEWEGSQFDLTYSKFF